MADALLGTFHPIPAAHVVALLEQRGIPHETAEVGARVEVFVDREWRDDVRAELAVNWHDLVRQLEPEELAEVRAASQGNQPGWYDAPEGAWIDRQGRLKVDPHAEEALEEDASRKLGPALAGLGAVFLLFGWYTDGSAWLYVLGTLIGLVGLFLPR